MATEDAKRQGRRPRVDPLPLVEFRASALALADLLERLAQERQLGVIAEARIRSILVPSGSIVLMRVPAEPTSTPASPDAVAPGSVSSEAPDDDRHDLPQLCKRRQQSLRRGRSRVQLDPPASMQSEDLPRVRAYCRKLQVELVRLIARDRERGGLDIAIGSPRPDSFEHALVGCAIGGALQQDLAVPLPVEGAAGLGDLDPDRRCEDPLQLGLRDQLAEIDRARSAGETGEGSGGEDDGASRQTDRE